MTPLGWLMLALILGAVGYGASRSRLDEWCGDVAMVAAGVLAAIWRAR